MTTNDTPEPITLEDIETLDRIERAAYHYADALLRLYPPRYASINTFDGVVDGSLRYSDYENDTHYIPLEAIFEVQGLSEDEIDALVYDREQQRLAEERAERERHEAAATEAQILMERRQLQRLLEKYGPPGEPV